jgi:GMP synthase-like glutamine amidotransferase
MKVLTVQNIKCETLGRLEGMLLQDGYDIEQVDAREGSIPASSEGYAGVIILGGPMAVYDNYDYLQLEQNLIRSSLKSGTAVLGICLGSQLIAQAAGGRVYRGTRKEIGWHRVKLTSQGNSDIFRGVNSRSFNVFQWHGDTYELPDNAVILARNELYPQAFRIGSAVGIQFHLEVDKQMIMRWTDEYREEMKSEKIRVEEVLPKRGDEARLESICRVAYRNFFSLMSK